MYSVYVWGERSGVGFFLFFFFFCEWTGWMGLEGALERE